MERGSKTLKRDKIRKLETLNNNKAEMVNKKCLWVVHYNNNKIKLLYFKEGKLEVSKILINKHIMI